MICFETTSLCYRAARPAKTVSTHTHSWYSLKMEFYPEYFSFLHNTAVQREHDVQESILFMAKQSGNVDPDVRQSMNIIKIHGYNIMCV